MDRLWTPWRYTYITEPRSSGRKGVPTELEAWPAAEDKHCVFCNMIASVDYAIAHGMGAKTAEKAAHIVARGSHCFICLNAFPYASAHGMVVPYRHLASLAELEQNAANELIAMAQQYESALRNLYKPDGINLGMNLGEAAGAGVAGHLHLHVLPRWFGDTNFMTVTAETRVLPETLDTSWDRLSSILNEDRSS